MAIVLSLPAIFFYFPLGRPTRTAMMPFSTLPPKYFGGYTVNSTSTPPLGGGEIGFRCRKKPRRQAFLEHKNAFRQITLTDLKKCSKIFTLARVKMARLRTR